MALKKKLTKEEEAALQARTAGQKDVAKSVEEAPKDVAKNVDKVPPVGIAGREVNLAKGLAYPEKEVLPVIPALDVESLTKISPEKSLVPEKLVGLTGATPTEQAEYDTKREAEKNVLIEGGIVPKMDERDREKFGRDNAEALRIDTERKIAAGEIDSPMMAARRAEQKERATELRDKRIASGMIKDRTQNVGIANRGDGGIMPTNEPVQKEEESRYDKRLSQIDADIKKLSKTSGLKTTRAQVKRAQIDALNTERLQLQQLQAKENSDNANLRANLTQAELSRKLEYDKLSANQLTEAQRRDHEKLLAKEESARKTEETTREQAFKASEGEKERATKTGVAGIAGESRKEAAGITAKGREGRYNQSKEDKEAEAIQKKNEDLFQKAGGENIRAYTSLDAVKKPEEVKEKLEAPSAKALMGLVGSTNYAGGDKPIDLGVPKLMSTLRRSITEDMSDRKSFVDQFVQDTLPKLYKTQDGMETERAKGFNSEVSKLLTNLGETAYMIEYQRKFSPGEKDRKKTAEASKASKVGSAWLPSKKAN